MTIFQDEKTVSKEKTLYFPVTSNMLGFIMFLPNDAEHGSNYKQ